MNQIICTLKSNLTENILYEKKDKYNSFKFLLSISLALILLFVAYQVYLKITLQSSQKFAESIMDSFKLMQAYNSSSYNAEKINDEIFFYEDSSFSVIGVIEIDKINISYPILSNIDKNLLKISPCRFYGPYPNNIGNLCIAGHNYKNDTFFSNLSKLKIGDIIKIYDTSGILLEYKIYSTYKTNQNDLSCTNQDTKGLREITLITCDSFDDSYRLVIKAKEIL